MIKARNKLFARRKSQPENDHVTEVFKKFKNKIKREITKSKKYYFANYFKDCSGNVKKTWQGIRAIINIKNPTAPKARSPLYFHKILLSTKKAQHAKTRDTVNKFLNITLLYCSR